MKMKFSENPLREGKLFPKRCPMIRRHTSDLYRQQGEIQTTRDGKSNFGKSLDETACATNPENQRIYIRKTKASR
jgi:hypothetical protein